MEREQQIKEAIKSSKKSWVKVLGAGLVIAVIIAAFFIFTPKEFSETSGNPSQAQSISESISQFLSSLIEPEQPAEMLDDSDSQKPDSNSVSISDQIYSLLDQIGSIISGKKTPPDAGAGTSVSLNTTSTLCTDPDGENYYSKGYTKNSTKSVSDYCVDVNTVNEFSCRDGSVIDQWHVCTEGCMDGACIPETTSLAESCIDSDNGLNYFAKGTVSGYVSGISYESGDRCLKQISSARLEIVAECSGIGCVLHEGFCRGTVQMTRDYVCPDGCSNGACLSQTMTEPNVTVQTCTDTDGGKNYYNKGTLTFNAETYTDYCKNSTTSTQTSDGNILNEMYCVNNNTGYTSAEYTCPNGCNDGACGSIVNITQTCTDSDGGKNYYVKGAITIKNDLLKGGVDSEYDDFCEGSALWEMSCTDNRGISDSFSCPKGCDAGMCLNSTSTPLISVKTANTWTAGKMSIVSWNSSNAPADAWVGKLRLYKGSQLISSILPENTKHNFSGAVQWGVPFNITTGDNFVLHIILNTGTPGSETKIAEAWSPDFSVVSSVIINVTCTDSDGGKNYYLKGTMTSGLNTFTDSCKNDVDLWEIYCFGTSGFIQELYTCPGECSNGACSNLTVSNTYSISLDTTSPAGSVGAGTTQALLAKFRFKTLSGSVRINSISLGSAYDSKISGIKLYKGATFLASSSFLSNSYDIGKWSSFSFADTEITDDIFLVYADINVNATGTVNIGVVGAGHSNTATLVGSMPYGYTISVTAPPCTDSDGGDNIYVAGTADARVNGAGSYFTDTCVYSNGGAGCGDSCSAVAEGMCGSGGVASQLRQCPSGVCKNGACITSTCTDSDGGKAYNVKGVVTYNNNDYSDFCEGSVLSERFCQNNEVATELFTCTSNCGDGACLAAATYSISLDSTSPSGNVTSGTSQALLAKFKLKALSGSVSLSKISLGSVYGSKISNIKLYKGTTLLSSASSLSSYSDAIGRWATLSFGQTAIIDEVFSVYADIGGETGPVNIGVVGINMSGQPAVVGSLPYGNTLTVTAQPACTDTDGGKNYYVKGQLDANKIDACVSSTLLLEYYCSGNVKSSEEYTCVSGCSNGACISSNTVYVSAYSSFSEAVSASGGKTLNIDKTVSAASISVPSNVKLQFASGNYLDIGEGATVTINGVIEAPEGKIFSGKGRVVFSQGISQNAYLEWWGATGNGVANDSLPLQKALDSGATVKLMNKVYFIPTQAERTGGDVKIIGSGTSTLLAKTGPLPSGRKYYDISGAVSWRMLKITGASSILLQDLTLDGSMVEGWNIGWGHYNDQMALAEIYNSKNVNFNRVKTTRFSGSFPDPDSVIGVPNPDVSKRYNTGPVFIHNSDDIKIIESSIASPSWLEGWYISQSRKILIDKFTANAGEGVSNSLYGYVVHTPINIDGPTTSDITITNSYLTRHTGSAMNIGGTGKIRIIGNTIDGNDPRFRPLSGSVIDYLGEGLDIGIESTSFYYGDSHPDTVDIVISNNIIRNTAVHSINVGGNSEGRKNFKNVVISNNTITNVWTGIMVYGAEDVSIYDNTIEKALNYYGAGNDNFRNYGNAIGVSWTDSALLYNNKIIPSGWTTVTKYSSEKDDAVVTGTESRTTRKNIEVAYSNSVTVDGNDLRGASVNNIHFISDNRAAYDNFRITNNVFDNTAIAPPAPIIAGDSSNKLNNVFISGNTINGAALGSSSYSIYANIITSSPILVPSKTKIQPGQQITITWSNLQTPTTLDWVGYYTQSAAHGSFVEWKYLNSCTQTAGTTALQKGSCSFSLPAGTYEFRLFPNDTYNLLATSYIVRVE